VRVALLGYKGKVGSVLCPALEAAGHEVRAIGREDRIDVEGLDAAIDFTRPDAVFTTVRRCLEQGTPTIVGTSGLGRDEQQHLDGLARERGIQLFIAPNFALGAMLLMRFAREAAQHMPRAEIVELHNEAKRDAPSGTARATAQGIGGDVPIHSVRLPGLVAHQEVLFGGLGQLLSIRHDTFSREAFVPGVLLSLERIGSLPPGLTVGLESLMYPASD
jgi:4-hydroxy-tetrahydrodipicolinate reductase